MSQASNTVNTNAPASSETPLQPPNPLYNSGANQGASGPAEMTFSEPRKVAEYLKQAGCTPFAVGFLTKCACSYMDEDGVQHAVEKIANLNPDAAGELKEAMEKEAFKKLFQKAIPAIGKFFAGSGGKTKDMLKNFLPEAKTVADSTKKWGGPVGKGLAYGGELAKRGLGGWTGSMAGQAADPTGTFDPGYYLGLGEGSLGHWNTGGVLGGLYGAMTTGRGLPKSLKGGATNRLVTSPFRNAQHGAFLGEAADTWSNYLKGTDPEATLESIKADLGVDDYYKIISGDFDIPAGATLADKQRVMQIAQEAHNELARGGLYQRLGAMGGFASGLPKSPVINRLGRNAGLSAGSMKALRAPGTLFQNMAEHPLGTAAILTTLGPTAIEGIAKPVLGKAVGIGMEAAAPYMDKVVDDSFKAKGIDLQEIGKDYQKYKQSGVGGAVIDSLFGTVDSVLGPIFGEGFVNLPNWAKGMILTGGFAAIAGMLSGSTGLGLGGAGLAIAPLLLSMLGLVGGAGQQKQPQAPQTSSPAGAQPTHHAIPDNAMGATVEQAQQQARTADNTVAANPQATGKPTYQPGLQGWSDMLTAQGLPGESLQTLAQQDPGIINFLNQIDPQVGMQDPETRNIIMSMLEAAQQ